MSATSNRRRLTGLPAPCAPATPPVTVWLACYASTPAGAADSTVDDCRRQRRHYRRSPVASGSIFRRHAACQAGPPPRPPRAGTFPTPGLPGRMRLLSRTGPDVGNGTSKVWGLSVQETRHTTRAPQQARRLSYLPSPRLAAMQCAGLSFRIVRGDGQCD